MVKIQIVSWAIQKGYFFVGGNRAHILTFVSEPAAQEYIDARKKKQTVGWRAVRVLVGVD